MRILGLIPARGGSKGVPRKNIKLLAGKPLLQYTAEAAMASKSLTRVILSTEDEEIAEIGKACGLDVPFLRPIEIAQDITPTLPVVQHALRWFYNQGDYFDAVCLLQPTNPLRSAELIDSCIAEFEKSNADSLITILPVPEKFNPHWVYFMNENGSISISTGELSPISRRQSLPPAFHREGSVYITKTATILSDNSLYGKLTIGHLMDPSQSVNIDTLADWKFIEDYLNGCSNDANHS